MNKFKTSFITIIPLGIKSACSFLSNLRIFTSQNESQDSDFIFIIRRLEKLISLAYSNYLIFLAVMLAIHLISSLFYHKNPPITMNLKGKTYPQSQDPLFGSSKAHKDSSQRVFLLLRLILCYTLLFGCYQFLFSILEKNENINLFSLRNLDQADENIEKERLILSPSLNPGEILGSFSPEAARYADSIFFAVSKDGKTLFSVVALQILTIFDISSPKNPLKKGEVTVNQYMSGSILLSPDEQIVYVHGQKYLHIFSVSSHTTPTLLDSKNLDLSYIDACSMVISSDGKILFTSNSQNLKIWDVSRPRYATLLSTIANENGGPIVLSKDNTRLAIGKQFAFEIYNIAELRNPPALICSQKVAGRVHSIAFSTEESRIFIGVNEGGSQTVHTLSIMIFSLTNFMAPSLLVSKLLSKEQLYGQLWFHANREFAFFNTLHEFKILRISDLEENTLFSTKSHLSTLPFAASFDSKVNVLYFSGMINILKFNIDITPPKPFVHFKPNALKVIDQIDYNRQLALAFTPDEKNFFLVRTNKTYPYFGELIPYETKSCATFEKMNPSSSFTAREFYISGESENTKWSLVSGKNFVVVNYQPLLRDNSTIFVIDTTDKNKSKTIVTLQDMSTSRFSTTALTLTKNEKNIIFINDLSKDSSRDLRLNIKTLNYQRLDSTLRNFQLPSLGYCHSSISSIKVNKDDGLLFAASCDLLIYNINNLQMPTLESSYKLDDISQTLAFTLSKDEKIIYLLGLSFSGLNKLLILDISNTKSPRLLSTMDIERTGSNAVELSQDEKTLFIGFTNGLLMLDIRVPTQPKIFGFKYFLEEMYAPKLSNNGSIFYAVSALGVKAFDVTSNYILSLKNSNFLIGGSYSITLNVLKLNKNFNFDYMMSRHKFLKASLFSSSNTESVYSALPNWISFNKEQSFIKIEPNSASTKGAYKISVGLSTQVQSSSFLGLELVPSEIEAENLILNLLQSGYIDNRGYLSGDLDLTQEQLRIDPKYKKIEKDIRMILLQNYIEAIGEISVSPSLNLSSDTKYLQISSLSQNTIYVAIQLDQNYQRHPYFLTKTYPYIKSTITNDRSVLLLEGTLANINEALKEVLVDVGQLSFSSGRINITDGINPKISQSMDSILKYFKNNSDTIHVSKRGYLEVSFLIKDSISVSIQLLKNSRNPYFLTKAYPFIKSTITNNRSLLLLEGSLENVNEALKEILIDLDQASSCHGLINATDNINPPISRYIDSISTYFTNQTDTIYASNNHLQVSSLNKGHLTVTIQLDQDQAYFVNKLYSFIRVTITNSKTLMYLEGSMDDINEALETILIDLGSLASCGGLVTVSDGINPLTSKQFKSISDYFHKNEKPFYNPNLQIQGQINKRPFYTGLYSMIELNSTTFTDNNSLPLEFSLEMEDSSQELPSWISLKGLSLMGTPPEKYSPLSYHFKLRVKNEFKENIVPFTLDVHISFIYGAKLVGTFVGYLFSFIGLVLSLNKIYNVLAKKYYRYPSSFKLRVGEKITDNQIFPIAFIKQEIAQSKGIFKALKKYIAQNLIEYFVESEQQILDKEKVIATLDMLDNEYYKNASKFSRGVIQQLIINMITQMQLSSRQEKITRDIFHKVKDKWINLVFPKSSSSSACPQFMISSERLEKELRKISPDIFEKKKEDLADHTQLSAELLFSTTNKMNMDLLKNAILAYAFSFLNLNINSILIDVISYKKLKGNSLWHSIKRFLLRDLKPFVVLNKREIGYGIEYNIDDDVLFFSGQLTHDLKDNIIVVHVKNNRGRILSEFSITGADEEVRENSILEEISGEL